MLERRAAKLRSRSSVLALRFGSVARGLRWSLRAAPFDPKLRLERWASVQTAVVSSSIRWWISSCLDGKGSLLA